jgi:hypothetical protein
MAAEIYLLTSGRYQIEVMANLDKVPATGALIVVKDGLGFPARAFAILPEAQEKFHCLQLVLGVHSIWVRQKLSCVALCLKRRRNSDEDHCNRSRNDNRGNVGACRYLLVLQRR